MELPSLFPPALPDKVVDNEGGSYYAWTSSTSPILGVAKVCSSLLVLKPLGCAPPHYSDCSKIGYVIQGTHGLAGLVHPNSMEETVVELKKGDTIVVPIGVVSWWLNAGDDELHIVFLADNTPYPNPLGKLITINYYFLTGALGILKGFSRKSICKAFDLDEKQASNFTDSQKGAVIIKLDNMITVPKPSNETSSKLSLNIEEIVPDIQVENGGSITFLTANKQPSLDGTNFSAKLMKLDPNAMFGPTYYAGTLGVVELTYVVKGSCWVEIVDLSGMSVLDTEVKEGQIFVVPKFYVVAVTASEEGLECFSIITTSEPVLGQLAGKTSFWKAMTPQVVQASLNVDAQFYELLSEKLEKSSIITPSN